MPLYKVTDFLSEIGAFFKNNDAHKAMYSIMDVIKWLKMSEPALFLATTDGKSQLILDFAILGEKGRNVSKSTP